MKIEFLKILIALLCFIADVKNSSAASSQYFPSFFSNSIISEHEKLNVSDDEIAKEDANDVMPDNYSHLDLSAPERTILGLQLCKDLTLKMVIEKLGPAEIFETGDAAGSETKVVYLLEDARGKTAVSFISGEMGGVTYVTIERLFDPNVYGLKINPHGNLKGIQSISFSGGLKLGLTEKEVYQILGKANVVSETGWRYYFEKKTPVPKSSPDYKRYLKEEGTIPWNTATSEVVVKFINGKTAFIEVCRLEGIFD